MPKKTAATRSGTQRNKPKVHKSVELVRHSVEPKEPFIENVADTSTDVDESPVAKEQASTSVSTSVALDSETEPGKNAVESRFIADSPLAGARSRKKETLRLATSDTKDEEAQSVVEPLAGASGKGTAASRLAARRQAVQKASQRTAATLITAEHYAYVRRDLIIIGILAFIMFAVIIGLHFVPAIGG